MKRSAAAIAELASPPPKQSEDAAQVQAAWRALIQLLALEVARLVDEDRSLERRSAAKPRAKH